MSSRESVPKFSGSLPFVDVATRAAASASASRSSRAYMVETSPRERPKTTS
jgi:hypothetical protein